VRTGEIIGVLLVFLGIILLSTTMRYLGIGSLWGSVVAALLIAGGMALILFSGRKRSREY